MKHEKHVQKRMTRMVDPAAPPLRPPTVDTKASCKSPTRIGISIPSTAAAASKPATDTFVRPATCSYPTSSQIKYIIFSFSLISSPDWPII